MKSPWWFSLLIVGSIVIRLPIVNSGFVSDDFEVRSLASQPHAWLEVWQRAIGGNVYRPVGFMSLLLDHAAWGDRAVGFHLTSIVLHGVNAMLLAWFVLRWTKRRSAGWLAGGLFLLYPANHEAVTWISGRFDVLALTLGLLALGLFARPDRWRWLAAPVVFAACLTKEPSFILPLIFALLQAAQGTFRRTFFRNLFPPLIAVLLAIGVRAYVLGDPLGGYRVFGESLVKTLTVTDAKTFLLTPLAMVAKSINSIFAAVRFPFLREVFNSPWPSLGWLVFVAALTIGCERRQRKTALGFLAATYLLLIPVIPLLRFVSRSLESSRFWYAPSAALLTAVAILILGQGKKQALVLSTVAVIALGAMFVVNTRPWQLAGEAARRIREQFTAVAPTMNPDAFLVFQDIPDNRFGAYVFRRGFGEFLDTAFPHRFPDRAVLNRTYAPRFTTCASARNELTRFVILRWQRSSATFVDETARLQQRLAGTDETGHNEQVRKDWVRSRTLPEGVDTWTIKPNALADNDRGVVFASPTALSLMTAVPELTSQTLPELQFDLTATAQRTRLPVSLYWKTENGSYDEYQRHILFPVPATGQREQVTVALCTYVPWLVSGAVTGVRIQFPADLKTLTLHRLTFSSP